MSMTSNNPCKKELSQYSIKRALSFTEVTKTFTTDTQRLDNCREQCRYIYHKDQPEKSFVFTRSLVQWTFIFLLENVSFQVPDN